jgi:hypothetical protein
MENSGNAENGKCKLTAAEFNLNLLQNSHAKKPTAEPPK